MPRTAQQGASIRSLNNSPKVTANQWKTSGSRGPLPPGALFSQRRRPPAVQTQLIKARAGLRGALSPYMPSDMSLISLGPLQTAD